MEDGKKYLTLPSNYVTLAQLQERWLNEQQGKQREKEEEDRKQREKEEEKRKQREKEEEKRKNREKEEGKRKQREKEEEKRKNREKEEGKRKREVQENRRQSKNGETNRTNSVSISSHRPFQRNFRNQSGKNHRTVEVSEPKVDESRSEAINYQEQNGDESKKKKNKRNKWMEKRSRAQKDLTEGTALLPPENEPEEKVPVVVTEMNSEKGKTGSEIQPHGKNLPENELEEEISVVMTEMNGEKKGVRSNFGPKGKSLAVYGKVWEQKGLLDGSAEIRLNFKNLSLNGGKESNQRSAEMNGGHWKYNRGSGRFDSRSTRKPIDANLVWVRKGEISDAARTQISGNYGCCRVV